MVRLAANHPECPYPTHYLKKVNFFAVFHYFQMLMNFKRKIFESVFAHYKKNLHIAAFTGVHNPGVHNSSVRRSIIENYFIH